jgi:hypothetical protein
VCWGGVRLDVGEAGWHGFDVNMPVNAQENLGLRVRPADRTEEDGGMDLAASVLRMCATVTTKIPGGLDEVVGDRPAI